METNNPTSTPSQSGSGQGFVPRSIPASALSELSKIGTPFGKPLTDPIIGQTPGGRATGTQPNDTYQQPPAIVGAYSSTQVLFRARATRHGKAPAQEDTPMHDPSYPTTSIWRNARSGIIATVPKPGFGQLDSSSSWDDGVNNKQTKTEREQASSEVQSPVFSNVGPAQYFSRNQHQHDPFMGRQVQIGASNMSIDYTKLGKARRARETLEKAAGPDSEYRTMVSNWFDGTLRKIDIPAGAFAMWNKQKETLIVTKKSIGDDERCEWTIDDCYKTKYDCATMSRALIVTKDNNGGFFCIDQSQVATFKNAEFPDDTERDFCFCTAQFSVEDLKSEHAVERVIHDFAHKLRMTSMDERLARRIIEYMKEIGDRPGLSIYSMQLHDERGFFQSTPELAAHLGTGRPMVAFIKQSVKAELELEDFFRFVMTKRVTNRPLRGPLRDEDSRSIRLNQAWSNGFQ